MYAYWNEFEAKEPRSPALSPPKSKMQRMWNKKKPSTIEQPIVGCDHVCTGERDWREGKRLTL